MRVDFYLQFHTMINAPSKLFVLIPVVVNQAELKKYRGERIRKGEGIGK